MSQDIIQRMREFTIFEGLFDKDLQALLNNGTFRTYQPGDVILKEGSVGQGFYVVLSGTLEVSKMSYDEDHHEKPIVMGTRKAGDVFGEMAIIEQKPRSAQVTATAVARVLKFDKGQFHNMMRFYPSFMLAIIRILCGRLRESDDREVERLRAENKKLIDLSRLQEKRISALQEKLREPDGTSG